jgi:hypothetical protein
VKEDSESQPPDASPPEPNVVIGGEPGSGKMRAPDAPQHTLGPWEVLWESCDCSGGFCHHGSYPYAFQMGGKTVSEILDFTNEDADLIAAAPDLLAAGKAVLLYTEEPEAFLPLEAALKALENTIAKAEGRDAE